MDRLGDDQQIMLQAPAQQHLRRCPAHPVGDLPHGRMVQVLAGPQRAVGLDQDVRATARTEQGTPASRSARPTLASLP